jgi:hypothetical protein
MVAVVVGPAPALAAAALKYRFQIVMMMECYDQAISCGVVLQLEVVDLVPLFRHNRPRATYLPFPEKLPPRLYVPTLEVKDLIVSSARVADPWCQDPRPEILTLETIERECLWISPNSTRMQEATTVMA